MSKSMTGWTIAAAELRIPWGSDLAAHRMIVVVDPSGAAVRQLNGLASWYDGAARRWRHKPIGYLPSDRLRGYDTAIVPDTFLPMNGAGADWRQMRGALASGDARSLAGGLASQDVESRLAPALAAIRRLNGLTDGPDGGAGLPYPFLGLGPNSNSFFSTLLAVMRLPEPTFRSRAQLVPGAGRLLLPRAEIDALAVAGSSQPGGPRSATSGARNAATSSAIASTP